MSRELTPAQRDAVQAFLDLIKAGTLDFDDVVKFSVNVRLDLKGPDGAIKDTRTIHNVICTAGKNLVLKASGGTLPAAFSYLAIGSGTAAATAADTALETELARGAATVSNPDSSTLQLVYDFAAGTGTGAVTEAGLFDATTAGHILSHLVFAVMNKGASDSLTITYTIT